MSLLFKCLNVNWAAAMAVTFQRVHYAAKSLHLLSGHGVNLACVLSFCPRRFGFYKYMKMDEEEDDRPFFFPNPDGGC